MMITGLMEAELRTAFMRLTLAWLGSGFIRGARPEEEGHQW